MKTAIAGIESLFEKALASLRVAVDTEGSKLSIAIARELIGGTA